MPRSTSSSESITPEIEEKLYDLIKAGNYPSVACQAVGVSPSVYAHWIRRGEGRDRSMNGNPDQVRFARRMREAEAIAETNVVEQITKSVEKNPEMGLKFLSRRYRARWAESREININWTVKALEAIKAGELTLEDLEAEIGSEMTEKVKLMIEAPQTVDGEYSVAPIEEQVKEEVNVG